MDPGMPEAPGRFELPNRGFADLRLTTWLRRQQEKKIAIHRPILKPPPEFCRVDAGRHPPTPTPSSSGS